MAIPAPPSPHRCWGRWAKERWRIYICFFFLFSIFFSFFRQHLGAADPRALRGFLVDRMNVCRTWRWFGRASRLYIFALPHHYVCFHIITAAIFNLDENRTSRLLELTAIQFLPISIILRERWSRSIPYVVWLIS